MPGKVPPCLLTATRCQTQVPTMSGSGTAGAVLPRNPPRPWRSTDRLGQDRFLEKYGFGAARSYRLVVDGKTYDSKAIVGAAHGFLPGQEALTAHDFSGGAATVGRLLSRLGFEVTQAVPGLTVGELIEQLSGLRRYRSPDGRLALYQPLTLLWAFGCAHQGLARMAEWSETEAALGGFLERHGEHPWPHYPVAALYHAGLWDLGGPRPVPPAHGNAPLHWFASNCAPRAACPHRSITSSGTRGRPASRR